jgi:hypothetical protein
MNTIDNAPALRSDYLPHLDYDHRYGRKEEKVSEGLGYSKDKCAVQISKDCVGRDAGYSRYKQFARVGPLLDACEACARVPYEVPPQFKEGTNANESAF